MIFYVLLLAALAWLAPIPAPAQGVTTQCIVNVSAQGTSDAITSAPLPCGTTTNMVLLTTAAANTTTAPTYQPLGSPAWPITRANGVALLVGDLQPGFVALLTSTGTSWVLLNPPTLLPAPTNEVSVKDYGAKCDGTTDDTTAFVNAAASGTPLVYVPLGCRVLGSFTVGNNQSFFGVGGWAGAWNQTAQYKAVANIILGPAASINSGQSSSVQRMVVVADGYTYPTSIRTAYAAARAFTGTAFVCNKQDFAIRDSLIIGFAVPVLATNNDTISQCDRLVMDQVQGDNTNGLEFILSSCSSTCYTSADIPRITNVEWFPFTSFPGGQFEQLGITGVANAGGLFQVTLGTQPGTPLQTGDVIQIGPTTGMATLYSSEPTNGWVITCTGNPNGTCTQFTLNGSTFAGVYSVAPSAYFSAVWRAGVGFYLSDAATAVVMTNYFAQSYFGAYYLGANSYFLNCTNCWSEWQPEGVAPPNSYGIDIEANSTRNTFTAGSVVAGIGVKINTSDTSPQTFVGMNSIAALNYLIYANQGFGQFVGGSLFPLNGGKPVFVGAAANLCLDTFAATGTTFTGTVANIKCTTNGTLAATGGAFIGTTPNPGAANTLAVQNTSAVASSVAELTVSTAPGNYGGLKQLEGASPVVQVYSGVGDTGGIQLLGLAGNVTISPGAGKWTVVNALPVNCVGAPTGALWNNAGAVGVCP